ncbi:Paternally expressed 10 [Rhizoctonia solani]|uniref:Paternally expressed 10 n=1 Tax=Rhizoctonia solani TaxID=456999 RepID=A0A8H7I8P5_9AGAM|nr:Paternally expressed 10 [Rhizoctonia solani]
MRSSLQASSHAGHSYPQSTMATFSLEWVTQLLLGLLSQVKHLKQEIAKIKEAGVETQTNVKNISQTVDVVKDGLKSLQLQGPHTPEGPQPKAVEETPRPLPKTKPIGSVSGAPFWAKPSRAPAALAQPTPRRAAPPQVLSPPPSPRLQPPIGIQAPPPPAPASHYPAPMKVDHPDAYTGKIGSKAKQWLTCMLAWTRLNSRMFPTDQEVLSFLLMNMKDAAGAWAHPHLDQLGSHQAIIQTVEGFKLEFLAAFDNPDTSRAAKQKITTLTQSGTCMDYITKFRTLAMELDWNVAALQGQFACGLHWEVSQQIATCKHQPRTLLELQNAALVINNALCEERASHPPGIVNLANKPTLQGGQVPARQAPVQRSSLTTPTSCWKKNKIAAALPAPASSAARWPEKQAETLEVLIDSGATSLFLHPHTTELLHLPLIDLPFPCTITMLNGSSPQAGKIWKKATLTFSLDGKQMTETFLICNTRSHAAILGLKWLDAHNPEIDWNMRTITFPHTPPEHVAIAKEEEADKNPLEGVPPKYNQYAKVFGEEEFNKLPPHWHYNIGIELTEEGPLNLPLYSMTNAKSTTLKDWLRDELKAGKICPSKLSISSPVMFVPKRMVPTNRLLTTAT